MSQPLQLIEPSGSFPRARDSLGALRPEFENGRTNWGDCVVRGDVLPEVNRVPVVNGLSDRAVYPVPPGDRYQSRGSEGNPVVIERAATFAPEYRDDGTVMTSNLGEAIPVTTGARTSTTAETAETGGAPRPGAHNPGSVPVGIGPEPPYHPRILL